MWKHWTCSLALLASACAALPAQAQIDTTFGGTGYVALGFDPRGAIWPTDYGVVACPGPTGSLVAVGAASDFQRVVTAWLTPTGALDGTFSDDGKESFDVASGIYGAVGLCTSDGGIVLAYAAGITSVDWGPNALHLLRIDPATGKPDPEFGTDGTLRVDLDAEADDLGDFIQATALVQGANNDVLLLGNYRLGIGPHAPTAGFLLRIAADGTLSNALLTHQRDDSIVDIVTAGIATNGDIWIGGNRTLPSYYRTGFLARLDGENLQVLDMPQPTLGDNNIVNGGRVIDGARMGLIGANYNDAFFAMLDPDGVHFVALPTEYELERPQILPLPAGRLLIAASAVDFLSGGTYFAQLRPIGAGQYVFDTAFGDGGSYLAQAPLPPACPGEEPQFFARITLWHGAATTIGALDRNCGGSNDFDYLLLRLRADVVFGDGLEAY